MEKYQIIKRIGGGAFGEVYLARMIQTQQLVCIKMIDFIKLIFEEVPYQREIDNWINLDHINLVKYFQHFYTHDKLYIVMEYIEGGDLRSFLNSKKKQHQPLPEEEILYIFRQLVSALFYLHNQKIIHRDIKPDNIFLTKDLTIKIGDFGVSCAIDKSTYQRLTNAGSASYSSPEMMKEIPYSFSTDIWSLGCVFYELLTFELPFGPNQFDVLNRIQNSSFQPIPDIYSNNLKNIIEMILLCRKIYTIKR
jgi:NIMA (never in mitosis gene a)-related kinase